MQGIWVQKGKTDGRAQALSHSKYNRENTHMFYACNMGHCTLGGQI
jgi:hypothetical protein